jgi:hypothetical protein
MSSQQQELITEIHPADVVLGRGAGPNEHAGNIAFREIVSQLKPTYLATPNRKIKAHIARKVVKAVKAKNGRFLKRPPGSKPDEDIFILADEEVVLEKAKQALRHGRCTVNPRGAAGTTPPSTSSSSSLTSMLSSQEHQSPVALPFLPLAAEAPASIVAANGNSNFALPPVAQQQHDPLVALAILAARNSNSSDRIVDNEIVPPSPLSTLLSLSSSSRSESSTTTTNTPQTIMTTPTSSITDIMCQSMSPETYKAVLQLLIAMAEQKRNESSSEECLQILNLVESLINAKRTATVFPPTLSPTPAVQVTLPTPSSSSSSSHFLQHFANKNLKLSSSCFSNTSSNMNGNDGSNYNILNAVLHSQFIPKAA